MMVTWWRSPSSASARSTWRRWRCAPRRSPPTPSCRPRPGSRASQQNKQKYLAEAMRQRAVPLPTFESGTMSATSAPSISPAAKPAPLDLQQIYTWLLADGMIRKAEVKELYAQSQGILKNAIGPMHPLCAVAHGKLLSALPPHKLLTLDALCEWLAARTGLAFTRIDPLKIDFTRVADVMSASYAARFNILPLELNG